MEVNSFRVPRFLKPALIPTRVLRSRAKVDTRDMWDEIENCEKRGRKETKESEEHRRWLQTFPQNSGDRVSYVYTLSRTSAIHKGIVKSLDTKEPFRSTRLELLYLFLDSIVIRGCVTIDLCVHKESVRVSWRFLTCVYSISHR